MPRTPSFPEVLEQVFNNRFGQLKAIEIGTVTDWDKDAQTATIQPVVLLANNIERPPLVNVPVIFPSAYYDVQPGESGVILYADVDWKTWFRTGENSIPETTASHDVSLGVFIPGARPMTATRTIPTDAIVLEPPAPAGEVLLGSNAASKRVLHEGLDLPLDAFLTALNTWGLAVAIATGVSFGAVTTTITNLKAADYFSENVKVDD